MGFFKDVRSLQTQAKEMGKTSDPGARFREMKEKVESLNESMEAQTTMLTAPLGEIVDGDVSIVSATPIGSIAGGGTMMSVSVLVVVPGQPPTPSSGTIIVPAQHAGRVQPGAVLEASVQATNTAVFAIDWSASHAPSP